MVSARLPAQTIPTANLSAWFKADNGVNYAGTNDKVSFWTDASGTGKHATQSTAAAQPRYYNSGVNARPIITFDGGDSLTYPGTIANSANRDMHVFVVARSNTAGGMGPLISTGFQNGWLLRFNGYNLEYVHPNASASPKVTLSGDGGWDICEVKRAQLNITLGINGLQGGVQSIASYTASTSTSSSLGNYGSTYLSDGSIAEVIIYDAQLGSFDRETVLKYLAQKYNIALILPGFPSVKLTAPDNESTVFQMEPVTVTATTWSNDANAIASVNFYANGAFIGQRVPPAGQTAQWTTSINWTPGAAGTFNLTATTTLVNAKAYTSPSIKTNSQNKDPNITVNPGANPNPVLSTSTNLSVTASDDRPESQLKFTWSYSNQDPGLPTPLFSSNGTNAAKNTTVTFGKAGNYALRVEVQDTQGGTATSRLFTVQVDQSPTTLAVSPSSSNLTYGIEQQFTATGTDQFGDALNDHPLVYWTTQGGGTINDMSGLFTAGVNVTGSFSVTAQKGKWDYFANPKFTADPNSTVTGMAQVTIAAPSVSLDTDGDSLTDSYELNTLYPNGKKTSLNLFDSDYDGMSDGWEVSRGLNPTDFSDADGSFGNGLSNVQEYRRNTVLPAVDNNGDGLYLGSEISLGLDSSVLDIDGDGWSNAAELLAGTNMFAPDSDGDGVNDPIDFYPLDPSRTSAPGAVAGDTQPPVITLTSPSGASLN